MFLKCYVVFSIIFRKIFCITENTLYVCCRKEDVKISHFGVKVRNINHLNKINRFGVVKMKKKTVTESIETSPNSTAWIDIHRYRYDKVDKHG